MRREIRRIVKEGGLTAVYVTHDQEEALSMADRMAVMESGRVAQMGTPETVYRQPVNGFVAGFIGETNLVAGKVAEVRGDYVKVGTAAGPLIGKITEWGWRPAEGEEVVLSVRPEVWRIESPAAGSRVTGKIIERTYLGQRIQYQVETRIGRQDVVEMNPHVVRDPGESEITLVAPHDEVVVLKP